MMTDNLSAAYMLRTAFEYEVRNNIDIKVNQLLSHDEDLSEEESDTLKKLMLMKEYFRERIGELGKVLP